MQVTVDRNGAPGAEVGGVDLGVEVDTGDTRGCQVGFGDRSGVDGGIRGVLAERGGAGGLGGWPADVAVGLG
ncbi:MAG: hypothetical protein U5R31_16625 [Acidimicrobiia bacterium]|nr:hypothetical protein [Acidimicrobiia bacterium]